MLFGDVFGPSFLIVTERACRIQELLGILVDKGSGRYSRDCAIMHLFLRPLPAGRVGKEWGQTGLSIDSGVVERSLVGTFAAWSRESIALSQPNYPAEAGGEPLPWRRQRRIGAGMVECRSPRDSSHSAFNFTLATLWGHSSHE